jgi:phosphatidylserine/phosphatidylglycerophosphate/cardiolipin synthase-like enzyme
VAIRVLIDSLHGLHESWGAENPLLSRLGAHPGIQLRTWNPVHGASVEGLKRRNHCKLCLIDGRLALVGGRNLLHEYYTGFGEARLTAHTPWREVPWLDAGGRLEGPAVAGLARAFGDAGRDAGGAPFPIAEPAPVGSTEVRVIPHCGLEDATTLEAYLELIHSARDHLYAVNGFPLMLELQHALLAAHRRGVRVRVLSGHLLPLHDGAPFAGPFSQPRALATEFVHSRLDPLVEAGVEVYLFRVPPEPTWDAAVGAVQPHVHAKLLSVDGARCTLGSANLDVTSAYWESELLLVVEDAAATRSLEARLDALLAQSVRVRAGDPGWEEAGRRRAWMRHWPGVLSV